MQILDPTEGMGKNHRIKFIWIILTALVNLILTGAVSAITWMTLTLSEVKSRLTRLEAVQEERLRSSEGLAQSVGRIESVLMQVPPKGVSR